MSRTKAYTTCYLVDSTDIDNGRLIRSPLDAHHYSLYGIRTACNDKQFIRKQIFIHKSYQSYTQQLTLMVESRNHQRRKLSLKDNISMQLRPCNWVRALYETQRQGWSSRGLEDRGDDVLRNGSPGGVDDDRDWAISIWINTGSGVCSLRPTRNDTQRLRELSLINTITPVSVYFHRMND